jgi:hypothetical protein
MDKYREYGGIENIGINILGTCRANKGFAIRSTRENIPA